ncbi:hypothetical protein [Bailinhaonella thermotolerans]|uniref:Uncharacterized protein n=1 Tax=Bailinhaonella thermotolerans TaxID=1070861 RepID=A0A3A4B136_9ACTN|nr:hypothetical protein [Bailinhaonella thermotolerans]RJL35445.1 hypothetical protein D5H75_01115 [Bailinhaonella thermotolerans]
MSVNYTPAFRHKDWIDNVDRVRAAGDNGFNARFHALEAEFATLSQVIAKVNEALQLPAPRPVKFTLTPALITLTDPWEHVSGAVSKPIGSSAASGMMSLSLPHRATITELRACGRKKGGNLFVNVYRQNLAAGSAQELIVGLTLGNGPFDTSNAVTSGDRAKVDNDNYRYYLTAELDSAPTGPDSAVQLTCFQLTCLTP